MHVFGRCLPCFRRDLSQNSFHGHSPPSTDSSRAVISYRRKNMYVYKVLDKPIV